MQSEKLELERFFNKLGRNRVATMGEPAWRVRRRDGGQPRRNRRVQVLAGPGAGPAQGGLELAEGLLDRGEVGRSRFECPDAGLFADR